MRGECQSYMTRPIVWGTFDSAGVCLRFLKRRPLELRRLETPLWKGLARVIEIESHVLTIDIQ